MSAKSALHLAWSLGILASTDMPSHHFPKSKPHDPEAAARLRAARIERKKQNFRRRYNLDR